MLAAFAGCPHPTDGCCGEGVSPRKRYCYPQTIRSGPISNKPSRPYRPWPMARKYRERIRRMQVRAQKKYSISSLQFDFIQSELVRLPHYFGVCPLPSEEGCTLNLQDLLPNSAIEREKQLRAQRGKPVLVALSTEYSTPILYDWNSYQIHIFKTTNHFSSWLEFEN